LFPYFHFVFIFSRKSRKVSAPLSSLPLSLIWIDISQPNDWGYLYS
jgi:hypothetical protein